jgi:hypothetical protein
MVLWQKQRRLNFIARNWEWEREWKWEWFQAQRPITANSRCRKHDRKGGLHSPLRQGSDDRRKGKEQALIPVRLRDLSPETRKRIQRILHATRQDDANLVVAPVKEDTVSKWHNVRTAVDGISFAIDLQKTDWKIQC